MSSSGKKEALFYLDGVSFLGNYGKLESSYKYYRGTMKTLAWWSDTTGGGRFTKLISLDFVDFLKQGMLSEKWPSKVAYNEQYGRFKAKIDTRSWMLQKNVYENVGVIGLGKHSQTVGIKRNIKVPRLSPGGQSHGSISVTKYAMINEFGQGSHPARPLFQPAMLEFVSRHFPPMAAAVAKAIKEAADKEKKRQAQRLSSGESVSTTQKGDAGSVISQSSMGEVADKNPDADFSYDIGTEGLRVGGSFSSTKALNATTSRDISDRMNKDSQDAMVKMAASMGMSVDALNDFLSNG